MLFLTNMYSEMFQMQFQKCNMVLTKIIYRKISSFTTNSIDRTSEIYLDIFKPMYRNNEGDVILKQNIKVSYSIEILSLVLCLCEHPYPLFLISTIVLSSRVKYVPKSNEESSIEGYKAIGKNQINGRKILQNIKQIISATFLIVQKLENKVLSNVHTDTIVLNMYI